LGHRFAVTGKTLHLFERRVLPITGSENDRNNAGFSSSMPFKGTLHLVLVTGVRGQEIGADQKQDNGGSPQVGVNLICPGGACWDLTIVPRGYDSSAPELTQVLP